MIWRGKKGEMERRQGDFIGMVRGRNGRAFNRELRRSNSGRGSVSGEFSGWSLMMTCGVHMSERERGITVPVREMVKWAVGSFLFWAKSLPRALFYFYFSLASFLFCFLNSFITFVF
jgi:hypothetical protein